MIVNDFDRINQVKNYLSRYKDIKPNLRRIENKIRENEAQLPSVTAAYSERVNSSGQNSAIEQFVINMQEDNQRNLDKQKYWLDLKHEIEDFLENDVLDDYERRILKYRYLDNKTWDNVAYINNYASRDGAIKAMRRACLKLYPFLKTS